MSYEAEGKARAKASHSDTEEDDSKTFPMKLMEILADEGNGDAICWLPHGKAFIVRNRTLFAEKVMPLHFSRKAKYSSFTRKLNRWNFVRVSSGPELGAYYHEFFLRDKPQLAAQMFCKNARTKLAMASNTPNPTDVMAQPKPKPAPTPSQPAEVAAAPALHPPAMPAPTNIPPNVLLNALQKDPDGFAAYKGLAPAYVASNLQILERHLQILQEEHAKRIMMQRLAMESRSMGPPHGMPTAAAVAQGKQQPSGEQLMQMRRLMELRARQRQGRAPTKQGASAA